VQLVAGLAGELNRPNLGLWALVDLSNDFDSSGRYRRLQRLRHAATHRFVVARRERAKPASTALIEHIRWEELKAQVVRQLQLSRAALFYLARAVDAHGGARSDQRPRIPLPRLPPPKLP
jgi:hypothetical protein